MKVKVSELTRAALDWAVAACLGHNHKDVITDFGAYIRIKTQPAGILTFCPSTDWAQGGPIIARESIGLMETEMGSGEWEACKWLSADKHMPLIKSGPTPLVAAMRCYVASQLGDEVDVPDELTQGATA